MYNLLTPTPIRVEIPILFCSHWVFLIPRFNKRSFHRVFHTKSVTFSTQPNTIRSFQPIKVLGITWKQFPYIRLFTHQIMGLLACILKPNKSSRWSKSSHVWSSFDLVLQIWTRLCQLWRVDLKTLDQVALLTHEISKPLKNVPRCWLQHAWKQWNLIIDLDLFKLDLYGTLG
jgi:hypothetical protein